MQNLICTDMLLLAVLFAIDSFKKHLALWTKHPVKSSWEDVESCSSIIPPVKSFCTIFPRRFSPLHTVIQNFLC